MDNKDGWFDKYPLLIFLWVPTFVLYCAFVMMQINFRHWLIAVSTIATPFTISLITEWPNVKFKEILIGVAVIFGILGFFTVCTMCANSRLTPPDYTF